MKAVLVGRTYLGVVILMAQLIVVDVVEWWVIDFIEYCAQNLPQKVL